MGAAALTNNVHHLVLYEPSLGLRYPPGSIEAVESAVAAGDLDGAVVTNFVDILEMSKQDIDAMRASATPNWATRIAAAHTLPRECRVGQSWAYHPGQFDAITAPTLLLAGSDTPADLNKATHAAADAIPNTRIHLLEGHGHMAHKTDPAKVARSSGNSSRPEPGHSPRGPRSPTPHGCPTISAHIVVGTKPLANHPRRRLQSRDHRRPSRSTPRRLTEEQEIVPV